MKYEVEKPAPLENVHNPCDFFRAVLEGDLRVVKDEVTATLETDQRISKLRIFPRNDRFQHTQQRARSAHQNVTA